MCPRMLAAASKTNESAIASGAIARAAGTGAKSCGPRSPK